MPESNDPTVTGPSGPGFDRLGRIRELAAAVDDYRAAEKLADDLDRRRSDLWSTFSARVLDLDKNWQKTWEEFARDLENHLLPAAAAQFIRLGQLLRDVQAVWDEWRQNARAWVEDAKGAHARLGQKRFISSVPEEANPDWLREWAITLRKHQLQPIHLYVHLESRFVREWANLRKPVNAIFGTVRHLTAAIGTQATRAEVIEALSLLPNRTLVVEVGPLLAAVALPNPILFATPTPNGDAWWLSYLISWLTRWPNFAEQWHKRGEEPWDGDEAPEATLDPSALNKGSSAENPPPTEPILPLQSTNSTPRHEEQGTRTQICVDQVSIDILMHLNLIFPNNCGMKDIADNVEPTIKTVRQRMKSLIGQGFMAMLPGSKRPKYVITPEGQGVLAELKKNREGTDATR